MKIDDEAKEMAGKKGGDGGRSTSVHKSVVGSKIIVSLAHRRMTRACSAHGAASSVVR